VTGCETAVRYGADTARALTKDRCLATHPHRHPTQQRPTCPHPPTLTHTRQLRVAMGQPDVGDLWTVDRDARHGPGWFADP
jgi:hypothetical protein